MAVTMNRYWGPGGKNQWGIYRDRRKIASKGQSMGSLALGCFLVSHSLHQIPHYNWDIDKTIKILKCRMQCKHPL